jgi:hypothetical protein
MNRILRITLLLLSASTISHAQTGIYATFDASRYVEKNVFFTPPANSDNSENGWLYGPAVGLYSDFIHAGPIRFGTDVRGEFIRGANNASRNDVLLGLRLAVKPPVLPIKPYIQGSAGVAVTHGPGSGGSSTNLQYRVAGGVDYTILPHIDWRVIEVGEGSLVNYTFGSGLHQSNSLLTLATGIVLRLP